MEAQSNINIPLGRLFWGEFHTNKHGRKLRNIFIYEKNIFNRTGRAIVISLNRLGRLISNCIEYRYSSKQIETVEGDISACVSWCSRFYCTVYTFLVIHVICFFLHARKFLKPSVGSFSTMKISCGTRF